VTRQPHKAGSGRGRRARLGLTLVELVVSLAVSGIVLAAICSTMLLAGKALPSEDDLTDRALEADRVADRIAAELRHAICIPETAAAAVTFTVADRDGDGNVEVIRYAWAGEALTRQYNRGAVVTVLDDVNLLALSYDRKTVTEEYPGPEVEGEEDNLSYYSPFSSGDFKIDKDHWLGQYFRPPMPGDAVSWRVTRVFFAAQSDGPIEEEVLAQLRPVGTDRKPTGHILHETVVDEGSLAGTYQWVEVHVGDVAKLSPGQGLAMVLAHPEVGGPAAKVLYDNSRWGRLTTSDAGGSWSYDGDKCMYYYVFGRVSTLGADQAIVRTHLTGVRVAVQAGSDESTRADTVAQTVNAPEVLSAVWQCNFNADPTTIDFGADGATDWTVAGTGVFDPSTLDAGVWKADRILRTDPANDFGELTTVDVRFRSTAVSGVGAGVAVNADWDDGDCASIFARVQLQADGTQKLTVYNTTGVASRRALVTVAGLSGGFVGLRLLIDPGADTVNVAVNGLDRGTYTYTKVGGGSAEAEGRSVSLLPGGSAAEFDFVYVRVGGVAP